MKRRLPDSIAGRTILVLLVGLTLSHVVSMGAYHNDLLTALGLSGNRHLAERVSSIAHALAEQPPEHRERTAHSLSSHNLEAHWDDKIVVDTATAERLPELERLVRQSLPPDVKATEVVVATATEALPGYGGDTLLIGVRLDDGGWVSFKAAAPATELGSSLNLLLSTTLMAAAVILFSILAVRVLTAPLRELSRAAERLGTDMAAPPLIETGPREVRQAAHAFNGMQARIKRLVADRTQMLAAISHDLRTPITRLRLRAEFVEDATQRRKMLDDLAEMEAMIASVLAFIRDETNKEETRTVDVASLLETICADMADAGHDVRLEHDGPVVLRGRPLALKRALTNLIDNAVKYGHAARIALATDSKALRIDIDDAGPGIAPELRERVFAPFYRVESSRSRATGGTGLGLTVARSVIRTHGGDIELSESPARGLRATVRLPLAA